MSTTLHESRSSDLQITRVSRGMGSVGFVIDLGRGQIECSPRDIAELISVLRHSSKVRGALIDAFERERVDRDLIPKSWRQAVDRLSRRRR